MASGVVGRAAAHPYPVANDTMSRPGRSSPGTPGVSSGTANDFRMAQGDVPNGRLRFSTQHFRPPTSTRRASRQVSERATSGSPIPRRLFSRFMSLAESPGGKSRHDSASTVGVTAISPAAFLLNPRNNANGSLSPRMRAASHLVIAQPVRWNSFDYIRRRCTSNAIDNSAMSRGRDRQRPVSFSIRCRRYRTVLG